MVLASDGTIEEQGRFDELGLSKVVLRNVDLAFDTDPETSLADGVTDKIHEAKHTPSTAVDLAQITGDLTIYKYYFNSIGLKKGLTYLALYVGYVFFYKFPREKPENPYYI